MRNRLLRLGEAPSDRLRIIESGRTSSESARGARAWAAGGGRTWSRFEIAGHDAAAGAAARHAAEVDFALAGDLAHVRGCAHASIAVGGSGRGRAAAGRAGTVGEAAPGEGELPDGAEAGAAAATGAAAAGAAPPAAPASKCLRQVLPGSRRLAEQDLASSRHQELEQRSLVEERNSIVALSVSTSASRSSTPIASPSFLCQMVS